MGFDGKILDNNDDNDGKILDDNDDNDNKIFDDNDDNNENDGRYVEKQPGKFVGDTGCEKLPVEVPE